MQAITALAHLQSTVLYFVDISETCGYSIAKQVALYHSIKPLFANKPLLIVANKTDLKKFESLDAENRKLLDSISSDKNSQIIAMSNKTEDGINLVKNTACDLLLAHRFDRKLKSAHVKEILNQIEVTKPTPRDNKTRASAIPASVMAMKQAKKEAYASAAAAAMDDEDMESGGSAAASAALAARNAARASAAGTAAAASVIPKRRTEKDIEAEHGGAGVYSIDLKKNYMLENSEWNHDIRPEIFDGHNVSDFIDPDIEAKLMALEREEDVLVQKWEADTKGRADDGDSDLDEETLEMGDEIARAKIVAHKDNVLASSNKRSVVPGKYRVSRVPVSAMEGKLADLGVNTSKFAERARARYVHHLMCPIISFAFVSV